MIYINIVNAYFLFEKGEIGMNQQGVSILKCSCGSNLFRSVFRILEISSLVSRSGKIEYAPTPVFICLNPNCNKELDLVPEGEGVKLSV